jgi:hypothetical protein
MIHSREEYRFKRRVIVDDVGFETKPGMAEALKKALEAKGQQQFFFSSNLPREATAEQKSLRDKYPVPALLRRLNEVCQAVYVTGEDMCPRDGGF